MAYQVIPCSSMGRSKDGSSDPLGILMSFYSLVQNRPSDLLRRVLFLDQNGLRHVTFAQRSQNRLTEAHVYTVVHTVQ